MPVFTKSVINNLKLIQLCFMGCDCVARWHCEHGD